MPGAQSLTSYDGECLTNAREQVLFGHPKGLFFLAFTEAWERFSFYGMTALVVLYMVDQLLLPGHVEHIVGFERFRAAIESVVGPLSPQALASQIYGLYAGFVYFTPVLGGLIADRWIGQRNAVVIGAILMSAGHLAMAFDQSFLIALALLVAGSGLLKGNISAQVGALYPLDEESRRSRGFVIFSTGINVGAVCGPLLCGVLAQVYGWHYGFGAAGLCMLAGLATYLWGYCYLPARVPKRRHEGRDLTAADWRVIAALLAVMLISIFQSVAFYQNANVLMVWMQEHVALAIGPITIPIPWFASIDPLASIVAVPPLLWLWRWQGSRGGEPGDLAKMGIGAGIAAASNLVLVLGILAAGGERLSPLWPIVYCVGLGISFLYYWPTMLALVSRAAPAKVNATMMGIAFLSLFVSYMLIGRIGGFYEALGPLAFWAMHAAIGAGGMVLVLVFGRRISGALDQRSN